MQAQPAEQAEILEAAHRDYTLAPTPSHQLRYALELAAPGHAGSNLPEAERLLRELVATPETLVPAERAFAYLELQKVDVQLTLMAENRTLQDSAAHADRDRLVAANKHLQTEIDENARLRKELDEAHAKLDAAVREAYGMTPKQNVLAFLLALNARLADAETKGEPIQAPGLPKTIATRKEFVSADAIKP